MNREYNRDFSIFSDSLAFAGSKDPLNKIVLLFSISIIFTRLILLVVILEEKRPQYGLLTRNCGRVNFCCIKSYYFIRGLLNFSISQKGFFLILLFILYRSNSFQYTDDIITLTVFPLDIFFDTDLNLY
ncbi:hypothetical protein D3C76_1115130 [compost metagenome]